MKICERVRVLFQCWTFKYPQQTECTFVDTQHSRLERVNFHFLCSLFCEGSGESISVFLLCVYCVHFLVLREEKKDFDERRHEHVLDRWKVFMFIIIFYLYYVLHFWFIWKKNIYFFNLTISFKKKL
jgi:hypothetical protein